MKSCKIFPHKNNKIRVKMKNGIVISAILLQFVVASSFAQINLSSMDVASSDSLQRCNIRHFSPGNSGLKKVWKLSGKLSSNRSDKVMITKDSTDIVIRFHAKLHSILSYSSRFNSSDWQ